MLIVSEFYSQLYKRSKLKLQYNMSMNNAKMPKGIPYIIGNELAERFSYYGMRAILTVFMTKYLVDSSGNLAVMSGEDAEYWYHIFGAANYFLPIVGALLADTILGKYRTIILLSIVYCLGHLALAIDETRLGLSIGLTLIAIGSGGIKPCVSAHVGDQFDKTNDHLLDKIFGYFYIAINIGAFISTLLTPYLLDVYGPHIAFGLPGLLMLIATILFWMGRNVFVSVKPVGFKKYWEDITSTKGLKAIISLIPIYLLISIFWALFEQTGAEWINQAEKMDRSISLFGTTFNVLTSQVQAANSFMVVVLIPVFTFILYPLLDRLSLKKGLYQIGFGMLLSAFSFVIIALAEAKIQAGSEPSIVYQLWAYLFLSAGEVMVSVTALEFAYTQAPKSLKSFIMSYYLLSVSLGHIIVAFINRFIYDEAGNSLLPGASYYWFYVGLAVVASMAIFIISAWYKEERYIQTEDMIE